MRRFDYAPKQQVLKKLDNPAKLGDRKTGSYEIEEVHTNGTITIDLQDGVTERINIH